MHKFFVNFDMREKTVSVGGPNACIHGFDSNAIQLAVDVLKTRGGGTVKLSEGTFDILGPVRLYDNITLEGMGASKTLLQKVKGCKTKFVVDADYGELKAEVEDTSGFKKGMGIQLYDDDNGNAWAVSTAVITEIEGSTIYFDRYLVRDYIADKNGTVSNSCSIVEAVEAVNVKVCNFAIDGHKDTHDMIGGCRGGGIYFHKSKYCTAENVIVRNFNGDGFSWQMTEDITIRNCTAEECSNFGMHPGSGSLRSVVEGCSMHDNGSDGLFVCWRVQEGRFINNRMYKNGRSGICIGHKDSGNLFEKNHIYGNKFYGIYMRPETETNGAHNNKYRSNVIEDNGSDKYGYGIYIDSFVKGNVIEDNCIRDSGKGIQKVDIQVNHKIDDLIIKNSGSNIYRKYE